MLGKFQNQQWAVDDEFISSIKGSPVYEIQLTRLLETRMIGTTTYYSWPLQIAEKTWTDVEAFIEAFVFAINRDRSNEFDEDQLRSSIARAHMIKDSMR